jgi:hypothetical protein
MTSHAIFQLPHFFRGEPKNVELIKGSVISFIPHQLMDSYAHFLEEGISRLVVYFFLRILMKFKFKLSKYRMLLAYKYFIKEGRAPKDSRYLVAQQVQRMHALLLLFNIHKYGGTFS